MVSRVHALRYITAEDLAHAIINDSKHILIVDVRDHDYVVRDDSLEVILLSCD